MGIELSNREDSDCPGTKSNPPPERNPPTWMDLLQLFPEPMSVLDRGLNVIWANEITKKLFGDQIVGRKCFEVYGKGSGGCEVPRCSVRSVLGGGHVQSHETEVKDRLGKKVFLHCTAVAAARDESGTPTQVIQFCRDLRDRKVAETALQETRAILEKKVEESIRDKDELAQVKESLRESEEKYRQLLEHAPVGIHEIDLVEKRVVDVNDVACHYMGCTREEFLAVNPADFLAEESRKLFFERLEAIASGKKVNGNAVYHLNSRNGRSFWGLCNSRISYQNGRPKKATVVFQDITELKKTEEALRHSENQLRLLSSRLLTVQEEERKRIARDLHDTVLQNLAYTKMALGLRLKELEKSGSPSDRAFFMETASIVKDSINGIREVIEDLRPSMLDELGILSTIMSYCKQFEDRHPDLRIRLETDIREQEIPDSYKIPIFRIIQEGLNNVVKHSRAEHASLSLKGEGGRIRLRLADDGVGFDPGGKDAEQRSRGGLGLTSMQERCRLSGGAFSFRPGEEKGTVIDAVWPLDE